jgi:hypothetical protein
MSTYTGKLQITGVVDRPLDICLDLDRESLAIRTPGGEEIGAWPLGAVQITGLDDGFSFKIDGTPGWVRTDNDGAFANEIGLRWAPPRLRRLMAVNASAARHHARLH